MKKAKAKFRVGQRVLLDTGIIAELLGIHRTDDGKLLRGVWSWRGAGSGTGTCPEHLMRPVPRERGARRRSRG